MPPRKGKPPATGQSKRGKGRPTRYRPEFAHQAESLCRLGATDFELAKHFGVDVVTIHRWRNENEEFCKSVIAGKEYADERVVRSLYQRAVGYTFESEKVFQFQGKIVRAGTVEHVPPDPGAAMNWLANRRGKDWRTKPDGGEGQQSANLTIVVKGGLPSPDA